MITIVPCLAALLPPLAAPQEKAQMVFEDGMAQVVPAFEDRKQWIRHDLFVETEFDSDGDGKLDRVHVDVTRPAQTDSEDLKVHVIYETSPYFAGIAGNDRSFFWDPKHELGAEPPEHTHPDGIPHQQRRPTIANGEVRTWVPRGFAVVHSCSPGTGMSQGCPTVGGENESLAPKAVIDWLNGRAKGYTEVDGDQEVEAYWATGKVGMTGTSYNGTLPLAAATTGVDGLEAIIPVAPNTSYYHYYRSNGLVRHPGGYMGEDIDVLYDFIHSGWPDRREWCDCEVRDKEMAENQDRITGDYNDFWAGRDYLNQLDDLECAVLMAHAFNDWNVMPEHSVRIYEAVKRKGVPSMAYFHQGGHGGPPPLDLMNRWFTRYVCGVENGVEELPRSWVVREGDRRTKPTAYPQYPHPDAEPLKLFPIGDGNKVGSLGGRRMRAQQTLVDDVSKTGSDLAAAAESQHRLLFQTRELEAPVHLSGYAEVELRIASSKPAANLSVWLVSLPWTETRDINANIITRGWADPQNRNDPRTSSPLEPGEFVDLRFQLQPDDQIIPAGQRIGLMVFSSDRDFTLWPEAGTELTLDLGKSSVTLPVVGGWRTMDEAGLR